jgi:hypothetical protein
MNSPQQQCKENGRSDKKTKGKRLLSSNGGAATIHDDERRLLPRGNKSTPAELRTAASRANARKEIEAAGNAAKVGRLRRYSPLLHSPGLPRNLASLASHIR